MTRQKLCPFLQICFVDGLFIKLGASIFVLIICLLTGCGSTPSGSIKAITLRGVVQGEQNAVVGASIRVYAAGTTGVASAGQPLLTEAGKTDSTGGFSFNTFYACPSPDAQVYIVAQGGNSTGQTGTNNLAIVLMAMLGSCSDLSSIGPIVINEFTTIGSVWPVSSYMTSATQLGSAAGDPSFPTAVSEVKVFVNAETGTSPGAVPSGYVFQTSKINSLANVLASCISSSGGVAGDGTPCGTLFSYTHGETEKAPTDIIGAVLYIAQNPTSKVAQIFSLQLATSPFQPSLAASPSDWSLALLPIPSTPSISPASGAYPTGQEITLSCGSPNAVIYYTLDGSAPGINSAIYTGPLALDSAETVRAISVAGGVGSSTASSTYSISLVVAHLVFGTQPMDALTGRALSPVITVDVVDSSGNILTNANLSITLSIGSNPGGGTLNGTVTTASVQGIATFPGLSISSAGIGYTLAATSTGDGSVSSMPFNISNPVPQTELVQASGGLQLSNNLQNFAIIGQGFATTISQNSKTTIQVRSSFAPL